MFTAQVLLIIAAAATSTAAWGIRDDVLISMCRANCLHHLPAASSAFTSCWDTCRKVHHDVHAHGHLCETSIFHPGQHLACSYLQSHTTEDVIYRERQPLTATLEIQDEHTLIAEWLRPVTDATDLVYLVLWTDDNNMWWHQEVDTTQLHAVIEGPHFLYVNLQHRIFAVTPQGVIAEAILDYPANADKPVIAQGMVMDAEVRQKPVQPSTVFTTATTTETTSTTSTMKTTTAPQAAAAEPTSSSNQRALTVALVSLCVSLAAASLAVPAALAFSQAFRKKTAPAWHFV